MLLASAGLGLAPLAKKAALTNGAPPLALAFAVVLIAAVVALAFMLANHGIGGLIAPRRRTYVHVLVVGALGSGAVALLAILAMTGTTATNRGLFQSMYPVATTVAARLLLDERLRPAAYAVIGCMTLGLLAMNASGAGLHLGTSFWLLALTLPLIGLSDVYARRTLNDADPVFVTVGRLISGMLALALALPLIEPTQWSALFGVSGWVCAAGFATAGGLLGLYRAMNTAGASLAAAFAGMAPVVTLASEWWILDTTFSTLELIGTALVVGGAVVLALGGERFKS